jgi:GNAT superfamily N-acetyltransferase
MAGYFGSERQQVLQRRADESIAWTQMTPGACSNGRALCTDDPEKLGWEVVLDILSQDGALGFRLLESGRLEATRARLAEAGHRLDIWDVFTGDVAEASQAIGPILAKGLPAGLRVVNVSGNDEGIAIPELQAFMLANEVVPFSVSMLLGEFGPAETIVIRDAQGAIAACAHTYLPHNRFSPYHRYAWGGLVAVSPTYRGIGLGTLVNAMMVRAAFERLDANHIYELVSETNIASRCMVEACGLNLNPALKSGSVSGTAERSTK